MCVCACLMWDSRNSPPPRLPRFRICSDTDSTELPKTSQCPRKLKSYKQAPYQKRYSRNNPWDGKQLSSNSHVCRYFCLWLWVYNRGRTWDTAPAVCYAADGESADQMSRSPEPQPWGGGTPTSNIWWTRQWWDSPSLKASSWTWRASRKSARLWWKTWRRSSVVGACWSLRYYLQAHIKECPARPAEKAASQTAWKDVHRVMVFTEGILASLFLMGVIF